MSKNIYLAVSFFFLYACQQNGFIKKNPGLSYKIISFGQADLVQPGETLKFQVKQIYHDSVLSDTRDSLPFYQVYDSAALTPDSWEIFGQLRKGDSVVFKALTDSAFKNKWPPFVKKGEFLLTTLYVQDILGIRENARDDLHREINKKRKSMGLPPLEAPTQME